MTAWSSHLSTETTDTNFFTSVRDGIFADYQSAIKKQYTARGDAARGLSRFVHTERVLDDNALMDYIYAMYYVEQLYNKIGAADKEMLHWQRTLEVFDGLTHTHA